MEKICSVITGVTGFVGKWLSDLLISQNHRVIGLDRWPEFKYRNVEYHQCDILDTSSASAIFSKVRADRIFHLAAISYLPEADLSPRHAMEVNIMGTISILDAVRQSRPEARVLLIGSSKEYNDSPGIELVNEQISPDPTNFYGISKYAGELLGRQYALQFGMHVCATRSFNHTGPGQSARFVCSDWAKQIVEIEKGISSENSIKVGNLDAEIDFSDVRDVVQAYYDIIENGKPSQVYNVCSGRGISLKYILEYLISKSSKKIDIYKEDKKLRAHKTSAKLIGDNSKLKKETGWECRIPFEKTLDDLYEYWKSEL
jgi:GDP-4-dehydro-6-deoxy-D-mannose reductase